MEIKPGDLVVTLENNVDVRKFEGLIGIVQRVHRDSKHPYQVVGILSGGTGLWCNARLATKLDRLLHGLDDGN